MALPSGHGKAAKLSAFDAALGSHLTVSPAPPMVSERGRLAGTRAPSSGRGHPTALEGRFDGD